MKSTRDPDLSELAALRIEAAKLKLRRPEDGPEPGQHSGTAGERVIHGPENTDEYGQVDHIPDPETGVANVIHEWGTQLEALATELEAAAAAHPRLALLAAFSLGVVAGQLLSRKQD